MRNHRKWIKGIREINMPNRESVLILTAECVFILIYFTLIRPGDSMAALKAVGLASLVCLAATSLAIYKATGKLSYILVFFIFSYLFSFGQSMLVLFGVQLADSPFSITSSKFHRSDIIGSARLYLTGISFAAIGSCLAIRKIRIRKRITEISDKDSALAVGWFLLAVSIVPAFYLLIKDVIITFTVGYGNTLGQKHNLDKICSLISGLFSSSVILLIFVENRKAKRRIIYCIFLLYCALQVIGGSRIDVFRMVITLFFILMVYRKSITPKNFWKIFLLLIVGLFVFSVVSAARIYLFYVSDPAAFIVQTMQRVLKHNFLISAISEMGNTQIINTLVYSKCPDPIGYQYGFSYVKTLWAILPNIWGSAYTGYIGIDITFSPLYTLTDAGLGASYLSEAYWNFGWFSVIFLALFGYGLASAERIFTDHSNRRVTAITPLFLSTYILYFMIFMVRGEMLEFGRSFVYYAVCPMILLYLHKKRHTARAAGRIASEQS